VGKGSKLFGGPISKLFRAIGEGGGGVRKEKHVRGPSRKKKAKTDGQKKLPLRGNVTESPGRDTGVKKKPLKKDRPRKKKKSRKIEGRARRRGSAQRTSRRSAGKTRKVGALQIPSQTGKFKGPRNARTCENCREGQFFGSVHSPGT